MINHTKTNCKNGSQCFCDGSCQKYSSLIGELNNNQFNYKTIHENKNDLEQFYKPSSNPNDVISNLDRYECTSNSGVEDCWAIMEKVLDGEYVLFSDVVDAISILFSAQNND